MVGDNNILFAVAWSVLMNKDAFTYVLGKKATSQHMISPAIHDNSPIFHYTVLRGIAVKRTIDRKNRLHALI